MRPRPYRETTSLFTGILCADEQVLGESAQALQEAFGPFLFASLPSDWKFSRHYDDELGAPIVRSFLFFPPPYDPSSLADAKLATIALEDRFARNGRRSVNIDPGYLTLSKVVLASAKNYSHRLYLGKGIYAELTLSCHRGHFVPLPYTYHDYCHEETLRLLETVRDLLKRLSGPHVF